MITVNTFNMDYLKHAKDLGGSPPVGSPYSVALPGSEKRGRSKVYRHWRFQDSLFKTLDPKVSVCDCLGVAVIGS